MVDALFEVLDDPAPHTARVLPTGFSRGPWSPDALHGGPVAALVTRAAEALLDEHFDGRHLITRLTLDLERPVPLEPLTVTAVITRPGRKVQVAEVTITDDAGRRLSHASALAIRRHPTDLPDDPVLPDDTPPPAPPPDPTATGDWTFPATVTAYHRDATEHRVVDGSIAGPGPVTDWIRLVVPVVPGEVPSPAVRVAAASDFLNGVSWTLPGDEWLFINPDLTITLHRLPIGEDIAVAAVTRIDADGTGTAEADLFDVNGRLGRAVQTLLVEHR